MLDFFSDSPFGAKWRVLYWAMQHLLGQTPGCAYPAFDRQAHNLLCSELKQLYVMLTRCAPVRLGAGRCGWCGVARVAGGSEWLHRVAASL